MTNRKIIMRGKRTMINANVYIVEDKTEAYHLQPENTVEISTLVPTRLKLSEENFEASGAHI